MSALSPAAGSLRDDGPKLVGSVPVLTGKRNPRGVPQLAFIVRGGAGGGAGWALHASRLGPATAGGRAAHGCAPTLSPWLPTPPHPRLQDDIPAFLEANKVTVEETIQALSTMHNKYRFMESQTTENKARIKAKIPDITSSLEAVEMLIKKQVRHRGWRRGEGGARGHRQADAGLVSPHHSLHAPLRPRARPPAPLAQESGEEFTTFFGLADQVYTKATVAPQNRVGLWLGAGIMLEYTYDEARALLQENLAAAETKLVRDAGGGTEGVEGGRGGG